MDIPDPTLTLEALSNSLDELEGVLDPLFEQTLQQNLDKLDAIQKAKMSVLVAYVIQDLVMIYLKTKGIDPKTEPVTTEMRRVKSYFDKISEAEEPSKPSLAVDRAAANRFIKAAIMGVKTKFTAPPGPSSTNASNASDTIAPLDKNLKFLESKPEIAELSSGDESSEEEGLQIYGENEDVDSTQKAANLTPPQPGKKRKIMDVFAGYDAGQSRAPKALTSGGAREKKRRTKTK